MSKYKCMITKINKITIILQIKITYYNTSTGLSNKLSNKKQKNNNLHFCF